MKLKAILEEKGGAVHVIGPAESIRAAIEKLCRFKIGALLVLEDSGKPAGIITERDILIEVSKNAERLDERKVSQVMTVDLICAVPDDDLDYVMGIMTQNHIRHLPVVKDNLVVGIVSIGDIVKYQHQQAEVSIHQLRDYIQGG